MDLSVIIVNYKTKQFLKSCLESVFNQTCTYSFEVILINNDSDDLSDIKRQFPKIILLQNQKNIGFVKAMNQGIKLSVSRYIMALNPDVILENNYIELLVKALEKNSKLASVTGKLRFYDFAKNRKTNIIDSTGLIMKKTRHAYDRGQGENDNRQYDDKKDIWGVSAAAAIYLREALDNVKDKYGYFDERFFMYKDDVDLAWRLYNKKWKALYVPEATSYHRRGTGIIDPNLSFFKKMHERKNAQSVEMRRLAFRNQRLMQLKNDALISIIKDLYIVIPFIVFSLLYILFFEPSLLIRKWKGV